MSKIKIIKIEIGEAPSGFYAPYNPLLEEIFTKEVLPIQRFAYGKHYEEYYIRDEDKEKFVDLMGAYVKESRLTLLKEIQEFVMNGEKMSPVIQELIEREEKR